MNKLNLKVAVAAAMMVMTVSVGAEGSGTSFTFSDGGTTSNYAGNVQNDISTSSNGTVGAQYNCAAGANCGANAGGASSTTNLTAAERAQGFSTVTIPGSAIYGDSAVSAGFEQVSTGFFGTGVFIAEDVMGLVNVTDTDGNIVQDIHGHNLQVTGVLGQQQVEVQEERFVDGAEIFEQEIVGYEDDTTQTVGMNSLDVQLEISENQKETTTNVVSVPSMQAPMVNASNSDMCRHGVSGAMSQLGLGISGGMTLVDKNCEMLKQVRLLNNLGLRDIALAMLAQDSRIADAMRTVDSKRYGRYMNKSTETNLEDISANAETNANGKEIKHSEPGETNWNFGG